jgi:hypothetical protein
MTISTLSRRLSVAAGLAAAGVLATVAPAAAVTQAQAESAFRAAGVTWSSTGGCSDRTVSTCTSFDGMRSDTVNGVITLKQASGCAVNVTGGTEVGHAGGTYSHANGYKADISTYACVSSYITGTFAYIGERGDGAAQYQSGSGNVYALEGNHWDITYHNCGGC